MVLEPSVAPRVACLLLAGPMVLAVVLECQPPRPIAEVDDGGEPILRITGHLKLRLRQPSVDQCEAELGFRWGVGPDPNQVQSLPRQAHSLEPARPAEGLSESLGSRDGVTSLAVRPRPVHQRVSGDHEGVAGPARPQRGQVEPSPLHRGGADAVDLHDVVGRNLTAVGAHTHAIADAELMGAADVQTPVRPHPSGNHQAVHQQRALMGEDPACLLDDGGRLLRRPRHGVLIVPERSPVLDGGARGAVHTVRHRPEVRAACSLGAEPRGGQVREPERGMRKRSGEGRGLDGCHAPHAGRAHVSPARRRRDPWTTRPTTAPVQERQAAAVSPPSLFSLGTSSSPSHEVGTETTMSLAKVPGGGTGQGVKVRPVSFSYAST